MHGDLMMFGSFSIDARLRRQHAAFERDGYDGHNRRSGLTTMHRFALRRARRVWRQRLAGYYWA